MSYTSKTRKVLCGYCSTEIKEVNLGNHCKNVHGKPKLIKIQKLLFAFSETQQSKKSTHGDDSSKMDVVETAAAANNLCFDSDVVDVPKKSACVDLIHLATSCHISEQDGKLDSIISELDTLNLKIPDTLGSDINVIRSKLDVTTVHLSSASKTKPSSDSSEK